MTVVSVNPPAAASRQTLRVELGDRSYDIVVGVGLLREAGVLMTPILRRKRVFIVTDETVAVCISAV